MCKERWRTRDLLLEYNSHIMPPRPRTAGLGMVYPWDNLSINNLIKQLFEIASNSGFTGTESDFKTSFGEYLQNKEIIYTSFNNFPAIGSNKTLYFDLDEKILYYWDNKYIPINALLINNTILDAGDSYVSIE